MTDQEAIEQFLAALSEIRESATQYGEVQAIVSGGEVKFVNVTKPPTKILSKSKSCDIFGVENGDS